jgi:hypothetical protein
VCCALPANVDDCAHNLDEAAATNPNISKIRSSRLANRALSGNRMRRTRSNDGRHFGVACFMGCIDLLGMNNVAPSHEHAESKITTAHVKGELQEVL